MEKRKQFVVRMLPDHIDKVKRLAAKDVTSSGIVIERAVDKIKEIKEEKE